MQKETSSIGRRERHQSLSLALIAIINFSSIADHKITPGRQSLRVLVIRSCDRFEGNIGMLEKSTLGFAVAHVFGLIRCGCVGFLGHLLRVAHQPLSAPCVPKVTGSQLFFTPHRRLQFLQRCHSRASSSDSVQPPSSLSRPSSPNGNSWTYRYSDAT